MSNIQHKVSVLQDYDDRRDASCCYMYKQKLGQEDFAQVLQATTHVSNSDAKCAEELCCS